MNELRGGHQLAVEGARVTIQRYWQLPEAPPVGLGVNESQLCQEFSNILESAVKLRFRSDVPVALLQSGGLDSSAIARVVADGLTTGDINIESVTAFTAHFPDYALDETDVVKEFLKTCPGINLKTFEVSGVDLAANLSDFAYQMDEPVYSTTSFAHWSLMKEVRSQGIKVVINGQGSDEAFAGYGRYAIGYKLLDALLTSPFEFIRQWVGARRTMGFGVAMLVSQIAKACFGRKAVSNFRARFIEDSLRALTSRFHLDHRDHLDDLGATFQNRNLDRHLRGQLEHYGFNQILHYEDHSSMAHSIEIRSPFIDYRLMELAFRIPDSLKIHNGVTKRILRESFKQRLPEIIVGNHRKIGFNTPFEDWMRAPEMQIILKNLFNSSEFNGRTIWRARYIREKFKREDWVKFLLWRFINLELWARAYRIENL